MSHLLVYATAESRLHADLLIVRLKRSGIETGLISVLYPSTLRPNSTRCWIRGNISFPTAWDEEFTVSGMLGLRLNAQHIRWGHNRLVEGLCELGLTRDQSLNVEESLLEKRIVVAVEVSNEFDLPSIYHTLRGLAVEKVRTADTALKAPEFANSSRRYRRVYSAAELAMAHGMMIQGAAA
jgi:hypothetical protein